MFENEMAVIESFTQIHIKNSSKINFEMALR